MFETAPQRDPGEILETALRVRGTTSSRAGDVLKLLRRHDIPCSIDSFSTKGWTARLGSPGKGGFYAQQGHFRTLDAAGNWLLEEAKRHYFDAMVAGD